MAGVGLKITAGLKKGSRPRVCRSRHESTGLNKAVGVHGSMP